MSPQAVGSPAQKGPLTIGNQMPYQIVVDCLAASGLTQVQFARLMGIHVNTLDNWRMGRCKVSRMAAMAACMAAQLAGIPVTFTHPSWILTVSVKNAKKRRPA